MTVKTLSVACGGSSPRGGAKWAIGLSLWEKTEHLLHAEAAQEGELLPAGVFSVE